MKSIHRKVKGIMIYKTYDILNQEVNIGDTIVFNPPKYKGIVHGIVRGFSESGLPKIHTITRVHGAYIQEKDFYNTPKTGFAVVKNAKGIVFESQTKTTKSK